MASASEETTTTTNSEGTRDRQKQADLLVQALRPRYIQEMKYGNGRVIKESATTRLSAAFKYCSLLENTIKVICEEADMPVPTQCQLVLGHVEKSSTNDDDDTDRQSRKRKSTEHHVPSAHSSPIDDVTETPTTSNGGSGDNNSGSANNKATFAMPVVLETPINNTLSDLGIKKRRLNMDINNNQVSSGGGEMSSFQCGSYSLRPRSRAITTSTPVYSPLLKPKKKTNPTTRSTTASTSIDAESPAANRSDVDRRLHAPPNSASSSSLALIQYEPSKLIAKGSSSSSKSVAIDDKDQPNLSKQVKEVNSTTILENIMSDDVRDSQRNV